VSTDLFISVAFSENRNRTVLFMLTGCLCHHLTNHAFVGALHALERAQNTSSARPCLCASLSRSSYETRNPHEHADIVLFVIIDIPIVIILVIVIPVIILIYMVIFISVSLIPRVILVLIVIVIATVIVIACSPPLALPPLALLFLGRKPLCL
jgi:hypothetical protein